MKKNKVLFMLPSIFIFLLGSLLPVFKILVDIKNIENMYMSLATIFYLLIFILLIIGEFIELIYLINYLYTKVNMSIIMKIVWTLLLILFSFLIIPYFYMKYVLEEDKLVMKSLIYLIPVVLFTGIFIFGLSVYKTNMDKIKEERKRIEEERNEYKTKDGVTSFIFRHGYKTREVNEYDLFVQNDAKKVIFSVFTYETDNYEQKSVDDYINKAVSDIANGKEKFDLVEEKKIKDFEDKTITTVIYEGKTKESSLCIYKISVIDFKAKDNYLVSTVEVVTKTNYDLYNKELDEILKSSKLN